ncbi:hypothetical protein [Zhongshania sp.]|uniref:hypothetical protein n=1 Tax=Zhongshania sp. TaxID=1971902 RepID=UPI003565D031
MAQQAQGVVEKINSKPVGKKGSLIYSFVIQGTWYRTGFDAPPFSEGDEVRFQYEETQYGKEVVMTTIQSRKGSGKPPAQSGGSAKSYGGGKKSYGGGGGGSKDAYWEEKDRYDKEVRQPIIMYQAATQVAKDLVIAALNNNILPTAGSKKDDKYASFMGIVGEVRDELFLDYLGALKRAEAGEAIVVSDVPQETEAPIEKAETPPVEESAPEPSTDDWGGMEDGDDWN